MTSQQAPRLSSGSRHAPSMQRATSDTAGCQPGQFTSTLVVAAAARSDGPEEQKPLVDRPLEQPRMKLVGLWHEDGDRVLRWRWWQRVEAENEDGC